MNNSNLSGVDGDVSIFFSYVFLSHLFCLNATTKVRKTSLVFKHFFLESHKTLASLYVLHPIKIRFISP